MRNETLIYLFKKNRIRVNVNNLRESKKVKFACQSKFPRGSGPHMCPSQKLIHTNERLVTMHKVSEARFTIAIAFTSESRCYNTNHIIQITIIQKMS